MVIKEGRKKRGKKPRGAKYLKLSDGRPTQNIHKNFKDLIVSLKGKKKSSMPIDIAPMLATLVNSPIDESGWLYEIKWDGFRTLAYINNEKVDLRSRNNKNFNDKFYPVLNELKFWKINALVDGEIVVVNEYGLPDFSALQTWRSEADGKLVYYIFDILWLEGYDLMNVPLEDRRSVLEEIIPESRIIQLSRNFNVKGKDFFDLTDKMGLEGIMAKKASSLYKPDFRSKDWLKIKSVKQQEVIICGYTRNENSSKKFSAIIPGIYDHGELVPVTPVGTGFSVKLQTEILEKLKPLETKVCPFKDVPDYNKPSRFRPNPPKAEVTWVKPELVAEITYRTIGADGSFRHPSFKGIREDKIASEVVREEAITLTSSNVEENILVKNGIISGDGKSERKTLLNPTDELQVRNIGGHDLKFTNLSKIFWPEENVSKRDMLNYYYQVVPYMLPYLNDRPQTLNRFPNGIKGKSFYQKDVTGKVPDWIDTFDYFSDTDQRDKKFLVCTDEASLLYIASLACIEMNPWSSRKQNPDHPDWCIIDLDPDKSNTFEQVIETALVCKKIIDALGIPGYCKTSGSTGLHIYIPLGTSYTYEQSKEFGRAFVKLVHREISTFTSIERLTVNRKGKIYLDFLQNRPQATVAAPYSLRPKPGAPVSMPLHWDEVKSGLKMHDFNIYNAMTRLKVEGDLFKGVLGKGIDMKKVLVKMSRF